MVRALLDGSKTQTRRVMKVQPPGDGFQIATCMSTTGDRSEEGKHRWAKVEGVSIVEGGKDYFTCPYGYAGDRLWVRETFAASAHGPTAAVIYRADNHIRPGLGDFDGEPWRPSIFMPRAASRINLEITGVRVERLQAISESDAFAEGVYEGTPCRCDEPLDFVRSCGNCGGRLIDAIALYRNLWDSIIGAGSWNANPWVWVVEFRRVA
jgi:hypothetical protein